MGLIERDARLLDGGVELIVDGVPPDRAERDVLSPNEVQVDAGLLGLAAKGTEQSAPSLGAGGPSGLCLVLHLADVELAVRAHNGLILEDGPHAGAPDAGPVRGSNLLEIVVGEVTAHDFTGANEVRLGPVHVELRQAGPAQGHQGLMRCQDGGPELGGVVTLFLLLVGSDLFEIFQR